MVVTEVDAGSFSWTPPPHTCPPKLAGDCELLTAVFLPLFQTDPRTHWEPQRTGVKPSDESVGGGCWLNQLTHL